MHQLWICLFLMTQIAICVCACLCLRSMCGFLEHWTTWSPRFTLFNLFSGLYQLAWESGPVLHILSSSHTDTEILWIEEVKTQLSCWLTQWMGTIFNNNSIFNLFFSIVLLFHVTLWMRHYFRFRSSQQLKIVLNSSWLFRKNICFNSVLIFFLFLFCLHCYTMSFVNDPSWAGGLPGEGMWSGCTG